MPGGGRSATSSSERITADRHQGAEDRRLPPLLLGSVEVHVTPTVAGRRFSVRVEEQLARDLVERSKAGLASREQLADARQGRLRRKLFGELLPRWRCAVWRDRVGHRPRAARGSPRRRRGASRAAQIAWPCRDRRTDPGTPSRANEKIDQPLEVAPRQCVADLADADRDGKEDGVARRPKVGPFVDGQKRGWARDVETQTDGVGARRRKASLRRLERLSQRLRRRRHRREAGYPCAEGRASRARAGCRSRRIPGQVARLLDELLHHRDGNPRAQEQRGRPDRGPTPARAPPGRTAAPAPARSARCNACGGVNMRGLLNGRNLAAPPVSATRASPQCPRVSRIPETVTPEPEPKRLDAIACVRNLSRNRPGRSPACWHGGRKSVSAFFCDNLSVFFPVGERFFVKSVRAHQSFVKDEGAWRTKSGRFPVQEGIHAREHERYSNEMLVRHGYPSSRWRSGSEHPAHPRSAPPEISLAVTCALHQAFTALLELIFTSATRALQGRPPGHGRALAVACPPKRTKAPALRGRRAARTPGAGG